MMKILFLTFLTLLSFLPIPGNAKDKISITDLSGRTVEVAVPIKSAILGEGRFLPSIGILDQDDPTKRIVGIMGEFEKYDPATYAQYVKHFPNLDKITRVGSAGEASFSIETAFGTLPDVAFFGLGSGHGPNDKSKAIIELLESAGIPVVILDFRIDPLVNTPKSIEILGKLFGKEDKANEFLSFYSSHLNNIKDKLKTVSARPTVFMESHVGLMPTCCRAFGQQMMGRFIEWAGGKNAFGDMIPGTVAMVNVEHLMVHQPDFYIGTAIGSSATYEKMPNYLALGVNTSEEMARQTLENASKRRAIAQLKAVQEGRAFSIWHHFYNTPMNVVAVEAIAKWLHPTIFKDLDPNATLQTYFKNFQPVPLNGIYWVSLKNGERK